MNETTAPAQASPDLKAYLSLEDFTKILDCDAARPDSNKDRAGFNQWVDNYHRLLREILRPALVGFLKELKAKSLMHPIPGAVGHATHLLHAWNAAALDAREFLEDEEYYWSMIAEEFEHALMYRMDRHTVIDKDTALPSSERYLKFTGHANKGDFEAHEISSQDCHVTGKNFKVIVRNWNLRFAVYRWGAGLSYELEPMADELREPLREVRVTFETGEVLMADWFRIKAFTEAVDRQKPSDSINSSEGKTRLTTYYAEAHNFVSVCVGNSSPTVFVNTKRTPAELVVGPEQEDVDCETPYKTIKKAWSQAGFKIAGFICTDLWWVTMIDKAQLVKLIAAEVGEAEAIAIVDEYLEEESGSFLKVTVPPGEYVLSFSANHHREYLAALPEAEKATLPMGAGAFFRLKKTI